MNIKRQNRFSVFRSARAENKSPGTEKMDQKTESRKDIPKRAFPLVKDRTCEEELVRKDTLRQVYTALGLALTIWTIMGLAALIL